MIRPIPLHDRDTFYQNKYLNNIVDISLNNLDNNIFLMIIHLISRSNLKYIHRIIEMYESRAIESQEIYYNLKECFDNIYGDEINKDNLRGAYLELLVYKFLNKKYSSKPSYISSLHCNVEIFGNSDIYKTVDVFAFWESDGFVSENKIGALSFENHDIENLNKIYIDSNHYLKPYIITLATKSYIDKKLEELYLEDSTNAWSFGGNITVISADNIESFFS